MFGEDIKRANSDVDKNKLQLHILNLNNTYDRNDIDLINKVHDKWVNIWQDVFSNSNSSSPLNSNDLFRQSKLVILSFDCNIIGFNFVSHFDLRVAFHREIDYIKTLKIGDKLPHDMEKHKKIASIEYLSVLPEWRQHYPGLSFGEILIRLSILECKREKFELLIGTTRSDIGVTKIAEKSGFKNTGTSIIKCNYHCDLVTFPLVAPQIEANLILDSITKKLFSKCLDKVYYLEKNSA